MLALTAGTVVTPRKVIPDALLVLADGRIVRCGPGGDGNIPSGAGILSLPERHILPGFIDLHTHGLLGKDAFGNGLAEVIQLLPRHGVTSFLATTVTMPMDGVVRRLKEMKQVLDDPPPGACCLGIHLEGNFLSPLRTGMANPDWCQPLTVEAFDTLQDVAGGHIRMVTFAPEEGQAMQVIPHLLARGVIPSLGHSNATYEQAVTAIGLGMTHATHTFNAMSPFHHRAPGLVGAVLGSPQVVAQLIADGQHVHPGAMRLLLDAKGVQGVCLVSDSALFAGLPDGTYPWEGYTVVVRGGTCRLEDGTLAGAHKCMDTGFRTLMQVLGLPVSAASQCASEVPAHCLGLPGKKGEILPGCDADLVVMDEAWNVESTIVAGRIVWKR